MEEDRIKERITKYYKVGFSALFLEQQWIKLGNDNDCFLSIVISALKAIFGILSHVPPACGQLCGKRNILPFMG
jgi:hypothetical protein